MNKIFFITIFLLLNFLINAQKVPSTFSFDRNELRKVTADLSPSGNAVEYINFMDDDVWVGTSIGLSKSTDGGNTWENYEFGDEGISALGIKNDTVWVATWHPIESNGDIVPVGSGLHYSPDKGETWVDIPQPVDASDDSSIVYGINTLRALPLTVEEGNFSRDIGFMGNTIWIANFYGGLRKSIDNGETWEKVVLPPDYLDEIKPSDSLSFDVSPSTGALGFQQNLNHRFFSIRIVNDSTILVGTADGINLSTDGGVSWKKFNHQNQTNSISGNFILDINFDHSRNTIWATTWKAEGETEFYGLSSSLDFGENWQTFLPGENILDIGFTYNIDGTEADVLVAGDNGVFRSNDQGNSWVISPNVYDDNSSVRITTTKYRAVNSKLTPEGFNEIWFGSESGTSKFLETGSMWEGSWNVYLATPKQNGIAYPNPFSPSRNKLKIKYNFEGSSESVTIRILDFGMNLVKTLIQNADRTGDSDNIEYWNGRDEANNIVPNGVYFFRIDIGKKEPMYGKILVVR